MPYLLGIDLGTSSVKCIVIDEHLHTVACASEPIKLYAPRLLWTEQEPEEWWEVICKAIKSLLSKASINSSEIIGIGLSGQMHGLVSLDKQMKSIRPAILWNDLRTTYECNQVIESFGNDIERIVDHTNNGIIPGYTLPKILWMKNNEHENYQKLHTILLPKDYIRYKLTGELATDVSDASGTGVFNVKEKRWSNELIDRLGIRKEIFPKVYESCELTGKVIRRASMETGLQEGIPVFGGGGDSVCQTSGLGVVKETSAGLVIGTSGVVVLPLKTFSRNTGGQLQYYCGSQPNQWQVTGCQLSAGASMVWIHKLLMNETNGFENIDAIANDSQTGARKLIFLPYLGGERCPMNDSNARGVFFGLSQEHGKEDLIRSVMEGVTYGLRQIYDLICLSNQDIHPVELITSGGASKSPLWLQIQANIFNLPVKKMKGGADGGALGAAIIGGVGCGLWDSIKSATDELEIDCVVEPDKDIHLYAEIYSVYNGLYGQLKESFKKLANIVY
jgi:xylulokinase